jgi:hypothetical protein
MFETWAVPAGIALPPVRPGEPAVLEATPAWIAEVARKLRAAGEELRDLPAASVTAALGRVGERFLDPADPIRVRALELLPVHSGLSPAMAAAVLDGMAADWTVSRLAELVRTELGDPAVLDRFVPMRHGRVRASGPELCFQVVSGSVPGVGATALLRSLLVKAPTLLKPGRGDTVLPVLMARALRDEPPAIANAAAVVYWPGGSEALEDAALASADAVVVYGGDEAVRSLRGRAPATARFVAYPNRVGVGVVGRESLAPGHLHRTASEVAGAVAFFDQRGCVSPHVVFVEEGGAVTPGLFARELADAMGRIEEHLPGGALDTVEAAALHQLRGTAELISASGVGAALYHGGAATWTVVFDPRAELDAACVGRVVRVRPVPDALEVATRLAPLRGRLQTAGVAGCEGRLEAVAESLARVGVIRVAPFSAVPFPPPWWHHDGEGPLNTLLRRTDLEA